jgi:hypothetical protein
VASGRERASSALTETGTDESRAEAVFEDLTQHGYDVFIDYEGIASGNLETIILENIRARAYFLVLLTPNESGPLLGSSG